MVLIGIPGTDVFLLLRRARASEQEKRKEQDFWSHETPLDGQWVFREYSEVIDVNLLSVSPCVVCIPLFLSGAKPFAKGTTSWRACPRPRRSGGRHAFWRGAAG